MPINSNVFLPGREFFSVLWWLLPGVKRCLVSGITARTKCGTSRWFGVVELQVSGQSVEELSVLRGRVADLESMVRSGLRLTEKKRMILREILKISGRTTFTSAVDRVSRELAIPYSTVKWNMMQLRSRGLITAGTKERQSLPILITEFGKMAAGLGGKV